MEPPPLSTPLSPAAIEALKAKIRQEILAEGYTLPRQPESMDPSISDTKAAAQAQPCPETPKTQDLQETLAGQELPAKGRLTTTAVGSLTCDLCNTTLTSQAQLDQHRSGKKHKAKETKAASGSSSGTKRKSEAAPVGVFGCHLCQVSVNSAEMLDAHCKGKKHKAKETGRGSEEGVKKHKAKESGCGAALGGEEGVKKHKAKESGCGSALGGDKGVGVFMCGLCGVECNGQPIMDLHLNGKKHKANVEKLGKVL